MGCPEHFQRSKWQFGEGKISFLLLCTLDACWKMKNYMKASLWGDSGDRELPNPASWGLPDGIVHSKGLRGLSQPVLAYAGVNQKRIQGIMAFEITYKLSRSSMMSSKRHSKAILNTKISPHCCMQLIDNHSFHQVFKSQRGPLTF